MASESAAGGSAKLSESRRTTKGSFASCSPGNCNASARRLALMICLGKIHRTPDFANFDDCAMYGEENGVIA
jgi:hypothetical protein